MTLWQVLLALGSAGALLAPLLRGREEEYSLEPVGEPEDTSPAAAQRAAALESLRDLDFEHATGKVSDADHAALRAHYVSEAANALDAIQAAHAGEIARLENQVAARKSKLGGDGTKGKAGKAGGEG